MSESGSEQQWVVVAGSPADGFRVAGPFDSIEDASKWSDGNVPLELSGTVMELEPNPTWPD